MKTLPPVTAGPQKAGFEPRAADHSTFFSLPWRMSQSAAMFLSAGLTRLRWAVPPHIGQEGTAFLGGGAFGCQACRLRAAAKEQAVAAAASACRAGEDFMGALLEGRG